MLTNNAAAQIALTGLILIAVIFVLGFVADPIINLYLDPWNFFSPWSGSETSYLYEDESSTWYEHFAKGFASMGVLGFLKILIASPLSYFRIGGGRTRTTGRDRYEQVSWIIILIGVGTFLAVCMARIRRSAKSLTPYRPSIKVSAPGVAELLRRRVSASWTYKAIMMMTLTSSYDRNACIRSHSFHGDIRKSEKPRTFLNCHKLFPNTVSISLRAKIESARDLHFGFARLVQPVSWNAVLPPLAPFLFALACSWSTLPWLE